MCLRSESLVANFLTGSRLIRDPDQAPRELLPSAQSDSQDKIPIDGGKIEEEDVSVHDGCCAADGRKWRGCGAEFSYRLCADLSLTAACGDHAQFHRFARLLLVLHGVCFNFFLSICVLLFCEWVRRAWFGWWTTVPARSCHRGTNRWPSNTMVRWIILCTSCSFRLWHNCISQLEADSSGQPDVVNSFMQKGEYYIAGTAAFALRKVGWRSPAHALHIHIRPHIRRFVLRCRDCLPTRDFD